jgi:predicted PolB exonuclease-like 3'-5' exonuclease
VKKAVTGLWMRSGPPHVGDRSEKLIASFVQKIVALAPQLITFNGSAFDLSVLRYRQ